MTPRLSALHIIHGSELLQDLERCSSFDLSCSGEWISHNDQTQALEHFKNLLVLGVANFDLCDSMRGDHLFSLVHLKETTATILGWLYHFIKLAFLCGERKKTGQRYLA